MFFPVALTSGLFLGWSLGANDAANIFGTAVGTRMLTFKKAAIIASVFVIHGAVIQGGGASSTLSDLSTVNALAGAFTVSLCAALTVYSMTKKGLPVSTSQAVVGAIMGWALFTGASTNHNVLFKIVGSWVFGPILGAIFSALLYLLLRSVLKRFSLHVIILDSYIRAALIVVGAFGAFSLGANNIANVVGVFVPSAPLVLLDFGLFELSGERLLFLLGALAIAIGIFSYGKPVMETVGNGILSMTPEAAIVVVLAQAIVLFIFSSSWLSSVLDQIGLPQIPLVPVSSTQVVVGCVLGIGFIKGAREIKPKVLGEITLGWVLTPILAGFATWFMLFFVQNVFKLSVTNSTFSQQVISTLPTPVQPPFYINLVLPALLGLAVLIIVFLLFFMFRQQRLRLKAENDLLAQQNQYYNAQASLSELEVRTVQLQNNVLSSKLEIKRQELINLALSIEDQRAFLERLLHSIKALKEKQSKDEIDNAIHGISTLIIQRMSFNRDMEWFYVQVEQIHKDFFAKLDLVFPGLTEQERRLAALLRLNLSTKEIAALLNISAKSAETSRYRLRKRLNIQSGDNLTQFINNL